RVTSTVSFTPREKSVFNLLLNNSHQIVTIDQIGETLFPDTPNDFSLYSVSKTIQRLRDKLEQNGISGSIIQTKRHGGYLLAM
ncbi:MAG: helix-turn-helix domain-containing protein, partial [Acidobacteria bacterium]|nr:helix-turn-helix domain-containing protein [Acidobacteriota bacterium]